MRNSLVARNHVLGDALQGCDGICHERQTPQLAVMPAQVVGGSKAPTLFKEATPWVRPTVG